MTGRDPPRTLRYMIESTSAPIGNRIQLRDIAARAGIAAPIVFVVGLILITWASLDFMRGLGWSIWDHGDSAWPSGLAQGPYGWAQVANFAITGSLLLVFFRGLRKALPERRSARVAGVLLYLLAVGFILAAFPEDGPPFGEPETAAGMLHGLGFLLIVLTSFIGPIATAFAMRGDERWSGYALLSASVGVATFVFMFLLVFFLEMAITIGMYGFFVALLGWVGLVAARLLQLSD